MKKGINRADTRSVFANTSMNFSESSFSDNICVFISHIHIDKNIAKNIGEYITNAGFDIYLDRNDEELQQAVRIGDSAGITKCIENGINQSSHMMCLVSEETVNSWWVPYEIGFAKKGEKNISTLTLKNTKTLPAYLKIGKILRGIKSLNDYLSDMLKHYIIESAIFQQEGFSGGGRSYLSKHTTLNHPLDPYLDYSE